MAKTVLEVVMAADPRSLERGFQRGEKAADKFDKGVTRSSGRATKAIVGVGKAGALAGVGIAVGLGAALKKSVDAFAEAEQVSKQTGAALKSTGGAAKVSAKQISDLAGAISRKSGIDDEAIQSGENLLLTFTKVRNETGKGNQIFSRATQTITDMSVALGQDTKSSAIQLGKALNDPIKGISALSRVGVSFTAQQKDQIKTLVASGDTLKAQKVILKELNTEFGGSATAAGNTYAGSINKAKVAIGNLGEAIGGTLAPIIADGADKLSGFVAFLTTDDRPAQFFKGLGDAAHGTATAIGDVVKAAGQSGVPTAIFDTIKSAAGGAKTAVAGILDDFGKNREGGSGIGAAIGKTFADAVGRIDWAGIGSAVKKGVSGAFNVGGDVAGQVTKGIQAALSQINGRDLLSGLLRVVKEGIDALFSPSFWKENFAAILATVTIAIPVAKILKIPGAATLFRFISKPFFEAVQLVGRGIVSGLSRFGGAAVKGFVETITGAPGIAGAGGRLIAKFLRSVRDLPGHLKDLGKLALTRMGDGIESGFGAIGRQGGSLVTTLANGVRAKLTDLKDFFIRIGKSIPGAIAAGIAAVPGAITGAISGAIGGDLPESLKKKLRAKGVKIGDGLGRIRPPAASVSTTPGAPSGALMGANSALSPFARVGASFGLGVSSGKRASGGRTSSGGISYHGSGEALDLAGSASGMKRTFSALKSRYGSRLAELIHTPSGTGIKNGRPYTYTGAVAADHYDHVHVALDLGTPGPGIGGAGGYSGGKRTGDGEGRDIFAWAKSQGFTDAQAAGWVGNFRQESGLNPAIVNSIGAAGLGQWLGGRRQALNAFAAKRKTPWSNKATQLAFVMHELRGSESGAYARIKKARTVEEAALAIGEGYERYGGNEQGGRVQYARAAFNAFAGKVDAAPGGGSGGGGSSASAEPSPYAVKSSIISAALARAEGTAGTADDIKALGRQQGVTGTRIRKVQKALKGNVRGSTRVRLNEELSTLYGDRKSISQKIADLRKLDPATGREVKVIDRYAQTTDQLALALARAEGTKGTKDDILAVYTQQFSVGQRMEKIKKALKGKLSGETRQRLTQELTGLTGDRQSLGSKLTDLRKLDPKTGLERPSLAEGLQALYEADQARKAKAISDRGSLASSGFSLAQFTKTLQDDIPAQYAVVTDAQLSYNEALAAFGAGSAEAREALVRLTGTQKDYNDVVRDARLQPFRDSLSGLDADLIRAQVDTEGTADDLAVVRSQLSQAEAAYRDAVGNGDNEAIKEFGPTVISLREAVKSLEAAATADQDAIAEALKGFTDELKRQNDLASSQVGIQNSQLVKALADILSGQIVGVGLQGRSGTAGVGGTVSYGVGAY